MKRSRLEHLYQQKLVPPTSACKQLPIAHILEKSLKFFPILPLTPDYDILEIGPGRGDFLFHLSSLYPKHHIVAVEIGIARFDKLMQNHQKKNCKNVTLIRGDARTPVYTHFADGKLQNVFVLFPDPWPRNRHRHKRLLQIDFLETLSRKMKSGGEFLLVTDVQDYAAWAMHNLRQIATFENALPQTQPLEGKPTEIIPTFFAEKWLSLGRKFWSVRFRKK